MKKNILISSLMTGLKVGIILTITAFIFGFVVSGNRDWGLYIYAFISFFLAGFAFQLISKLILKFTSWQLRDYWLIPVIPAVLIAIGGLNVRNNVTNTQLRPFQAHLNEYLAKEFGSNFSSAPISGKIITINVTQKSIDPFFLQLPLELRATQPEDVGTIVFLDRGYETITRFTNGSICAAQTVQVTIVDNATGARLFGTKYFRGDDPVCTSIGSDSTLGPLPDDQVLKYLENLPRLP